MVREGPRWAFVLSLLPIIGVVGDVILIIWAWRRRQAKGSADAGQTPARP